MADLKDISNEYDLVQLPETEYELVPVEEAPVVDEGVLPDRLEATLRGAADTASLGLSENVVAGVQALRSGENKPLLDKYYEQKALEKAKVEQLKEQYPVEYVAGSIGGGVASSFVPGLGLASGFSKLSKAKQLVEAAKTGAKIGGVSGLVGGESETLRGDVVGTAKDVVGGAAGGAVIGGAVQGVVGGVSSTVGATKDLLNKLSKDTPIGQWMRTGYKAGKTQPDEGLLEYGERIAKEGEESINKVITERKDLSKVKSEILKLAGERTGRIDANKIYGPEFNEAADNLAHFRNVLPDGDLTKQYTKVTDILSKGATPEGLTPNINQLENSLDQLYKISTSDKYDDNVRRIANAAYGKIKQSYDNILLPEESKAINEINEQIQQIYSTTNVLGVTKTLPKGASKADIPGIYGEKYIRGAAKSAEGSRNKSLENLKTLTEKYKGTLPETEKLVENAPKIAEMAPIIQRSKYAVERGDVKEALKAAAIGVPTAFAARTAYQVGKFVTKHPELSQYSDKIGQFFESDPKIRNVLLFRLQQDPNTRELGKSLFNFEIKDEEQE